jgi:hypothetical protein
LFLFSALIHANIGLALIHGTKDHRQDAYGGYWKTDFIESLQPANHYVVHCDFSQYMWHDDAAHCVATQLIEFINDKKIDSLTVYSHSDGANIIRWIISNPTYNREYLILTKKDQTNYSNCPLQWWYGFS